MISVVIPTLNSEATLTKTLAALIPATLAGVVREVIVADGGSEDGTFAIADDAGARWVRCPKPSRGAQLQAGAEIARSAWLLFLHDDTRLEEGWDREVQALLHTIQSGARHETAAAFRFQLDDHGFAPRTLEALVNLRTRVLKFPYGDQGLLISRPLYEEIGGYQAMSLMEDVDLIRRLGRRRVHALKARALTSATRFRTDGYLRRVLRNQFCLALYYLNVSPERLAKFYRMETPQKIRQT